jgi:hypothetical protein
MSYLNTVQSLDRDPQQLELAYRQAVEAGEEAAFSEAIETRYSEAQDNVLLAAWHYRLVATVARVKARVIAWGWALPLGVLNGLALWLLSDDQRFSFHVTSPVIGASSAAFPAIILLAAPISAAFIVLFLALAGKRPITRTVTAVAGLAAVTVYALLLYPRIWPQPFQEQYLGLMVMHLALLAWATTGIVALMGRGDHENRFAFLVKSLEAFVVGGLLVIAGGLLTAITYGLFGALGLELPMWVQRLFIAGGGGLIVVLAVALVYDPAVAPARQDFTEGLSKLVALLMRLLLPLSVAVLLVYLAFIPFNWREPFENRDVLLIFNALLFAVIALLVGATPVHADELSERGQNWLRRGVIALAALALLVSLYALAAILYRTANGLTPNRLLFIGWDVVNIVILATILIQQARAGRADWLPALHGTFALGAVLYLAWALIGLLVPPWLFAGNPAGVAGLPPRIQEIVFQRSNPILLQCYSSRHIYLLKDGQKHWVKDMATFVAQGYTWDEVEKGVPCADLRQVPDGETIPPGSGSPPQP